MKSKNFFCDMLGFELTDIQEDKFVWIRSQSTDILLRPGTPPIPLEEYELAQAGIVLYTDVLEKVKTQLKAKGLAFKGIDGSENCLTFTDPDGNWFQLVNPKDH